MPYVDKSMDFFPAKSYIHGVLEIVLAINTKMYFGQSRVRPVNKDNYFEKYLW